ncbi:hypothetical protein CONPUDRAFT_147894 [Coniophora puteana RWD-64-598 SS2]|uniref:Uncharacterized protein n=1 Tax=Coniophora puteana (strain RWD-64-598) TaxID=741705 RepID=R7SD55_CONPW|nr:uncharacterized protein CONPUDRAFT_147894 [Coniophora puteana RWD-64-598 SS2]EIW74106.1 hypothetical protein CONPUDRAFT_147894 [Coniophora puteana RWD-64-598 SS2]
MPEEEILEHILLDCTSPLAPIRTVWSLAEKLWRRKGTQWPTLTIGTIFGCSLIHIRKHDGKKRPGATRLFRVLTEISAHLLWKLRCERVNTMPQNPPTAHPLEEAHNRWIRAVNERLTLDKLLTDEGRFGIRATKAKLVLQTWGGTLLDEDRLPKDWIKEAGVLVGITSRRPPGRNR